MSCRPPLDEVIAPIPAGESMSSNATSPKHLWGIYFNFPILQRHPVKLRPRVVRKYTTKNGQPSSINSGRGRARHVYISVRMFQAQSLGWGHPFIDPPRPSPIQLLRTLRPLRRAISFQAKHVPTNTCHGSGSNALAPIYVKHPSLSTPSAARFRKRFHDEPVKPVQDGGRWG